MTQKLEGLRKPNVGTGVPDGPAAKRQVASPGEKLAFAKNEQMTDVECG